MEEGKRRRARSEGERTTNFEGRRMLESGVGK